MATVFAFGLSDAEAKSKIKLPKITKVAPNTKVTVGKKLTLSGQNFVKGKKTLIVIFKRVGSKRTFTARGDASGKTRGTVVVPDVSGDLAGDENLFRLRVITKYGAAKAWTGTSISPRVILESKSVTPPAGGSLPPVSGTVPPPIVIPPTPVPVVVLDCDADGIPDGTDPDDDNDQLIDTIELTIGTEVCGKDTDSDGVDDWYEYRMAYIINGGPTLPYPGKLPWPNPLYDGDANEDHDQDKLTMLDEYTLWQYTGLMSHFYSDADADSDEDGKLDPAEDEDGDLLPNIVERDLINGANWLDPDTDGDGLCDGLDDADHDGPPTSLGQADCVAQVPNNGSPGGDPDPLKIDGDDNIYSNFYEWYIAGAKFDDAGDANDVCKPSTWPISPYCGEDQPWNPLPTDGPTGTTGATGP